jgi:hypothetical protein
VATLVVIPGVNMGMNVVERPVPVWMDVKVSSSPAPEQARSQQNDQNSDESLGRPLDRLGQELAEQNHRKSKGGQGRRVTQAPGQAQHGSTPGAPFPLTENQGGDRREMIRVGRVS